jgi:hypothetical protein
MAITPEQKWKNSILEYRKKCQKIMKISGSIRYVGVINEFGRTLTGMIKPNTKPLLKAEEVKNEFFIISTLMTLRKVFDKSLGKLDYIVIKHKKVSIIAYQKNKITYYISFERKKKGLDWIIPVLRKIV